MKVVQSLISKDVGAQYMNEEETSEISEDMQTLPEESNGSLLISPCKNREIKDYDYKKAMGSTMKVITETSEQNFDGHDEKDKIKSAASPRKANPHHPTGVGHESDPSPDRQLNHIYELTNIL